VNVIFCDNHLRFISEDIAYHVLTQLMTPKQNSVSLTYSATPVTPATWTPQPWSYTLNEADY
jgi:hypothetical protein